MSHLPHFLRKKEKTGSGDNGSEDLRWKLRTHGNQGAKVDGMAITGKMN